MQQTNKRFRPCSIDGCKRNSHSEAKGARGYCNIHYYRLRMYGDPLGGRIPDGEPLRFIKEVALAYRGSECLPWPYGKRNTGYGQLALNDKFTTASRFVCELFRGPAPTPVHEAAHNCGNRICVNPMHLQWKTASANSADKVVHGTHNRGERHTLAKLSERDVHKIRYLRNVYSERALAAHFDVSHALIHGIHHHKCWAWLPTEGA